CTRGRRAGGDQHHDQYPTNLVHCSSPFSREPDAQPYPWLALAIGVGLRYRPASSAGNRLFDRIRRLYILLVYMISLHWMRSEARSVKTAKLFKNGDSQAVRLPKEFRFAGDEVLIKRVGSAVVLLPKAKSWDTLVQSLDKFPADFMSSREQPTEVEQRDSLL